jgi:hypothetical protein
MRDVVKKSELLKAIREEIQRHNLDTFMSAEHKIVQTGCSTCQNGYVFGNDVPGDNQIGLGSTPTTWNLQ